MHAKTFSSMLSSPAMPPLQYASRREMCALTHILYAVQKPARRPKGKAGSSRFARAAKGRAPAEVASDDEAEWTMAPVLHSETMVFVAQPGPLPRNSLADKCGPTTLWLHAQHVLLTTPSPVICFTSLWHFFPRHLCPGRSGYGFIVFHLPGQVSISGIRVAFCALQGGA